MINMLDTLAIAVMPRWSALAALLPWHLCLPPTHSSTAKHVVRAPLPYLAALQFAGRQRNDPCALWDSNGSMDCSTGASSPALIASVDTVHNGTSLAQPENQGYLDWLAAELTFRVL